MGTAEFYGVVESVPDVVDSLVVHLEDATGGAGELLLFLVAMEDADQIRMVGEVRTKLRRDLSPRHVPDNVEVVSAFPRTLSGKKLEVPIKQILAGAEPASAMALTSIENPQSLESFLEMGRGRASD
jgi:acetoacetyl-CoA synthetase